MPVSAQSGVTAIAAGYWHSLALKRDGSVVAWGHNGYGQATVPVPAQSGVTAIAVGDGYSVALKSHSVVAWGWNEFGLTNVPAPALSGVIAIAAGDHHIVALRNDGSVVAWGNNASGQVTGTPITAEPFFAFATPVTLGDQVLSGVLAIAAGGSHTVALKNDGTVVAWGWNSSGQANVPAGLSGVIAVAAGWRHTVALKSDGSVVAWGHNSYGQTNVPIASESGVMAIAAGYEHTVALKTNGTVVAWGNNGSGGVTGTPTPAEPYSATASPVTLSGEVLSGVTAIAAGGFRTVALVTPTAPAITTPPLSQTVNEWQSATFTVAATGYALRYQWRKDGVDLAGATNRAYNLTFAPANQAGAYTVVVKNLVGSVTSAPPALLTVNPVAAGTVVAWGNNFFGQTTVPVAAQSGVTAIALGGFHTVALKNNGAVLAWGAGASDTGRFPNHGQSIVPAAAGSGVTAIAAGDWHSLALKNEGTVMAWGDNTHGQVTGAPATDEPFPASANPVRLGGQLLSSVRAIVAGGIHTVVLKYDGTVAAWGDNRNGQVTGTPASDEPFTAIANPVTLGGQVLSGVIAIAAGSAHTLALKNDGTVVAWGFNAWGQVTGTPISEEPYLAIANPVTLGGQVLSGIMAIAAGSTHTMALKNNGTVVAWGYNASGQVTGTRSTTDLYTAIASPVTLGAQLLSGVTAIAAGGSHTVTLKNDGTVVAWGFNLSGEVTGTPSDFPYSAIASPVTLGGQVLNGVTAIAAGEGSRDFAVFGHTVALLGFVPLLPALNARPNGNELILSWPTNAAGFTLQWSPNLTPPVVWIDSTDLPAVIGTQFTVTNSTSGTTRFYQLSKP